MMDSCTKETLDRQRGSLHEVNPLLHIYIILGGKKKEDLLCNATLQRYYSLLENHNPTLPPNSSF